MGLIEEGYLEAVRY